MTRGGFHYFPVFCVNAFTGYVCCITSDDIVEKLLSFKAALTPSRGQIEGC